jgi:RNA polymerase-binding transcription factor DksA
MVNFLDASEPVPNGTSGEFAMTKTELENYRTVLLALQKRLHGEFTHLADEALNQRGGDGNLSNVPLHMADLGTDNYEQENTLSLLQNEERTLTEVVEALERITRGTFGTCEECATAIPKARLKELPYARYCVNCARKLEQRT